VKVLICLSLLFCPAGRSTTTMLIPVDTQMPVLDATNAAGAGIFARSEFILFYSAFFIYLAVKLAG